jgi:hypothetical protein
MSPAANSACPPQDQTACEGELRPRDKHNNHCLYQETSNQGNNEEVSAVPTSAWHKHKLRRDDNTFAKDQQEGMDVVARPRVRDCETGTPMVEVKTLSQLHRLELIKL